MKKFYIVILMTLFLIPAGAFQYSGTKNVGSATQYSDQQKVDKAPLIENTDPKEKTLDVKEIDEEMPPTVTKKTNKQTDTTKNGSNKEKVIGENNNQIEDEIIIDGIKYTLIMDENKYPNLKDIITAVRNYGAKLYGIPNSDGFIILKDKQRIADMSTGVISVSPSHADMVKEMLTDRYEGIKENIDLVIKTGATVQVEWEQTFIGYHIELKDEWLIVNYY
ncbi:hypothetical protein [Lederbergia ruris]|uniref:Uncharacterized protein n=1 Tax=Lederbergia ruris TaxID=217495 RepID=A0ABQ4KKS7_9BACI|nr:hypothetical protein [Lederbergia ruris]GIN57744.1 hypothetical protein J8TS2_20630 [Lederbergia ruris]